MRFIGDIFRLLKDTTWPTRKESWRDFRSIMEYTAFFVVIIYIFDKLIVSGLIRFINCLLYTSPSPRDQRGSRMPSSA